MSLPEVPPSVQAEIVDEPSIDYSGPITKMFNIAMSRIEQHDEQQIDHPETIFAYIEAPLEAGNFVGQTAMQMVLEAHGLLDTYFDPPAENDVETPTGYFIHLDRIGRPGAFHVSFTRDELLVPDRKNYSEGGIFTLEWLPPVPFPETAEAA